MCTCIYIFADLQAFRFSESKTEQMSDPTSFVFRDTIMGRDDVEEEPLRVCVCMREGGREVRLFPPVCFCVSLNCVCVSIQFC